MEGAGAPARRHQQQQLLGLACPGKKATARQAQAGLPPGRRSLCPSSTTYHHQHRHRHRPFFSPHLLLLRFVARLLRAQARPHRTAPHRIASRLHSRLERRRRLASHARRHPTLIDEPPPFLLDPQLARDPASPRIHSVRKRRLVPAFAPARLAPRHSHDPRTYAPYQIHFSIKGFRISFPAPPPSSAVQLIQRAA
ncbi:uncharacterized protein PSFLO_07367 [Pseudozyma flocculosa]|uniref:Uncharacterized protein n=1 Tax=Pseudozyma flocculosa TaxID=84751 RepID=A0A5C3FDX3_9BASI|nr:uncharacterized protein PSFLO_07367 [Pseudozyma flocculosa]